MRAIPKRAGSDTPRSASPVVSAAQVAREFKAGWSMVALGRKYKLPTLAIEVMIREVARAEIARTGRKGR